MDLCHLGTALGLWCNYGGGLLLIYSTRLPPVLRTELQCAMRDFDRPHLLQYHMVQPASGDTTFQIPASFHAPGDLGHRLPRQPPKPTVQ